MDKLTMIDGNGNCALNRDRKWKCMSKTSGKAEMTTLEIPLMPLQLTGMCLVVSSSEYHWFTHL